MPSSEATDRLLAKARSNPRLVCEIALVLACKLTIIFALWFFFFGPDKRIEQTPEAVAAGILNRGDVVQTAPADAPRAASAEH
ncbi:MAG: cytochrome oxidase putative small subunit CydP [Duodenibacillus sp.]